MRKDTKRPNGTTKRVQYVQAQRGGVSSMGTKYAKGDPILHLSSSRCTGETFVLTKAEIQNIPLENPGRWSGPTKWKQQLQKIWMKKYRPDEVKITPVEPKDVQGLPSQEQFESVNQIMDQIGKLWANKE